MSAEISGSSQASRRREEIATKFDVMERETFSAAVARHLPGLRRYAAQLTRTGADAEDVIQDMLLLAWRRRELFRGDGPFEAWLRRLCHTAATRFYRPRQRRQPPGRLDTLSELVASDTIEVPFQHFELVDLWAKTLGVISNLPERQRVAVLKVKLMHCSVEQTAEDLQIAPGTVKANVHKGMQKVRTWLRSQEGGGSASADRQKALGTGRHR